MQRKKVDIGCVVKIKVKPQLSATGWMVMILFNFETLDSLKGTLPGTTSVKL